MWEFSSRIFLSDIWGGVLQACSIYAEKNKFRPTTFSPTTCLLYVNADVPLGKCSLGHWQCRHRLAVHSSLSITLINVCSSLLFVVLYTGLKYDLTSVSSRDFSSVWSALPYGTSHRGSRAPTPLMLQQRGAFGRLQRRCSESGNIMLACYGLSLALFVPISWTTVSK